MKILTYLTSLTLSVFLYFVFDAYLIESSGSVDSILPLISFYCTAIIFGFLSWFHLFRPALGARLLTIFIVARFLSWPLILFVEFFVGGYHPSLVEALLPTILSVLAILFVWKAEKDKDINHRVKIALAVPAILIGVYATYHFTSRFLS